MEFSWKALSLTSFQFLSVTQGRHGDRSSHRSNWKYRRISRHGCVALQAQRLGHCPQPRFSRQTRQVHWVVRRDHFRWSQCSLGLGGKRCCWSSPSWQAPIFSACVFQRLVTHYTHESMFATDISIKLAASTLQLPFKRSPPASYAPTLTSPSKQTSVGPFHP